MVTALGYSSEQIQELENSINKVDCDAVLLGTPADLRKRMKINKPTAKVVFEGHDAAIPKFTWFLHEVLTNLKKI